MEMSDSETSIRLKCASSRSSILRQWRNWRTGLVIETIDSLGKVTEPYWDKEFESVVLFHNKHDCIVFCDPLEEFIRLKQSGEVARYVGCEAVSLDRFNALAAEYGGENVHGPGYGMRNKELTLTELLGSNQEAREGLRSLLWLLLK